MGLKDDLQRFHEIGEQRREDLSEFITHGQLGDSRENGIKIPIKIVDLPEFQYDQRDMGGIGKGDAEPGDPVERPGEPDDDEEEGKAGDEPGEHEYYEMDPEEFARELDEELGLDLDPKGTEVIEETEGDFIDVARAGPQSMLDLEYFFREGLKRKLATDFDEAYVREALHVEGWGPEEVFRWARKQSIPVSKGWIQDAALEVPPEEQQRWPDIDTMEANVEHTPTVERIRREGLDRLPFRPQDERFRHPEIIEERQTNAVVVNIRDVSASMREDKRELVERTFTPLDWYLQGTYENAEFVYIAHDAEAWEVDREEFFGISSGGGTQISSAYELAAEVLEEYPWANWNRYLFAAGDSENSANDTAQNVVPLIEEIDANRHAYVETQPGGGKRNATHADEVNNQFDDTGDVVVARVNRPDDVLGAIEQILSEP